jgi:acyl-CoA thioesterase FadM
MRFRVRPQELDPLDHVNNGAYADWLDEAILEAHRADGDRVGAGPPPTSAIPRRMRLEYARAAELGESLEGVSWRAADGWSCLIARAGDGAELLRGRLELLDGRPTRAS